MKKYTMGHKRHKRKKALKESLTELKVVHSVNIKPENQSVSRAELQKKYEEKQSYKQKLSLVTEEENTKDDFVERPEEVEDTLDRRSNTYLTSGPMIANFRNIKGPGSELW